MIYCEQHLDHTRRLFQTVSHLASQGRQKTQLMIGYDGSLLINLSPALSHTQYWVFQLEILLSLQTTLHGQLSQSATASSEETIRRSRPLAGRPAFTTVKEAQVD